MDTRARGEYIREEQNWRKETTVRASWCSPREMRRPLVRQQQRAGENWAKSRNTQEAESTALE